MNDERRMETTGRVWPLDGYPGSYRTVYDYPLNLRDGETIQEDVNFEAGTLVARIVPAAAMSDNTDEIPDYDPFGNAFSE